MKSLLDALSHQLVQIVFVAWFKSKKYEGSAERLIQNMTESLWRAFSRSAHAQQLQADLGHALPKFDNSAKGKTIPMHTGSGTQPQPVAVPQPDPQPVTVPDPQPVAVSKHLKPCKSCGVPIPAFHGSAMTCNACFAAKQQDIASVGPVSQPDPQPVAVPQPDPHPEADPLMAMLAERLRAAGLVADSVPQAPVPSSADLAQSIADEVTAQIQAMLESGILVRRQEIRICVNDAAPVTVTGHAPKWFGRLLKLVQCRVNTLLVGPAGCGKTTAVEMLAKALNLPFARVSLSAGVDEGILQGWLLPIGANGQFTYVPSVVVTAYEHGGVVLLDELDAADPNMLIILSAMLDNGQWTIPQRHAEPVLKKHKDFIVVAAANTFGHGANRQHVGAQRLDERTLSRFRMGQILCDYDEALETALYHSDVVEFGQRLRTRCRALPAFGHDVSTRDIASAHVKLATFTPEEAWYEYFQNWNSDDLSRVHVQLDHAAGTAVCL